MYISTNNIDGTYNIRALSLITRFFFSLGNPLIFVCNLGVTVHGTYDNPLRVYQMISSTPGVHHEKEDIFASNNNATSSIQYLHLTRRNYYIHVDGALGASYTFFFDSHNKEANVKLLNEYIKTHADEPIVQYYLTKFIPSTSPALTNQKQQQHPKEQECPNLNNFLCHHQSVSPAPTVTHPATTLSTTLPITPNHLLSSQLCPLPLDAIEFPTFNFRACPGVMSLAMSSHKQIGAPVPGGIAFTLRKYSLDFLSYAAISYISSMDSTIAGSRSGLNAAILYDYLARNSHEVQMLKLFSQLQLTRLALFRIASAIGSKILSVARDKPVQYHTPRLDPILQQQDEFFNTQVYPTLPTPIPTTTSLQPRQRIIKTTSPANLDDEKDFAHEQQLTPHLSTLRSKGGSITGPVIFNYGASLAVMMPQPSRIVCDRYSLSCDVAVLDTKYGYKWNDSIKSDNVTIIPPVNNNDTIKYRMKICHIYCLDHVSIALIDELANDLSTDPEVLKVIAGFSAP